MTINMSSSDSLTEQERAALLSFLGYGNPGADFVFVGMEEGLTETADFPLIQQLRERAALDPIVDLVGCSVHPGKYLTGDRPLLQRTWTLLIAIMLAVRNQPADSDAIRAYQCDRLGRSDGESLLLELMPLPARSVAEWAPYDVLFEDFPNREAYFDALLAGRIAAIQRTIAYGPKLVILYGSGYWPSYRHIFPSIMTWQRSDVFEYARVGTTGVILMPHPVARSMNVRRDIVCKLARKVVAED